LIRGFKKFSYKIKKKFIEQGELLSAAPENNFMFYLWASIKQDYFEYHSRKIYYPDHERDIERKQFSTRLSYTAEIITEAYLNIVSLNLKMINMLLRLYKFQYNIKH